MHSLFTRNWVLKSKRSLHLQMNLQLPLSVLMALVVMVQVGSSNGGSSGLGRGGAGHGGPGCGTLDQGGNSPSSQFGSFSVPIYYIWNQVFTSPSTGIIGWIIFTKIKSHHIHLLPWLRVIPLLNIKLGILTWAPANYDIIFYLANLSGYSDY